MVCHFESDHQSPSLARKLQLLSVSESQTSSASEVTSSGVEVTSSQDTTPPASSVAVSQTDEASSSTPQETRNICFSQESDNGVETSIQHSNPSNLRSDSIDTDSTPGELTSESRTSLALSDFSQEPSVSENLETKTCDNNSTSNNSDQDEHITPESSSSDKPESAEPVNPIVTALKSSSITLEHNRVGSANHFKTVIVSHDQAEDIRKSDKSGRIVLRLGKLSLYLFFCSVLCG